MPRSHLWGFLTPIFCGLVIGFVALMSVGLPMALLLAIFGVDPVSSIVFVLGTDRGTLAGVGGAMGVTVAMWIAHLLDRRIALVWWLGVGTIGYAAGALGILQLVPPDAIVAPAPAATAMP